MLNRLSQSKIFLFRSFELFWKSSIRNNFDDYNYDNSLCKNFSFYYEFCLPGHNIAHMKIFADKIKKGRYVIC